MGLISKLKGKDKHDKHEEEDTSPVATNSPSKSYYTGPQSDATPAGYGKDSTPAAPTGPPGTNTTSGVNDNSFGTNTVAGSHGQLNDSLTGGRQDHGSSDRYDNGPSSGNNFASHGQLNDSLAGGRHGAGSSDRYEHAPSSGNNFSSHGQLNDTMASGGRHGPSSSSDYNNTPGAFPGSDTGLGQPSGRSNHVDRDGYGQSGPGYDQDRYGGTTSTSSGPGYGSAQNFSGRDTYAARDAPGPYGTRDDYAGDRGPASRTVGPHESNIANVADPRVLPQPEKMHNHNTVGPHQSDTLNRMDPRVTADPRAHGLPRDPRDAQYDSRDPRDARYESDHGRQTGGFVGGPHERLENHGSIPTAGGARVGAGASDDPYSRGVVGRDPYDSRSNDGYGPGAGAGFNEGPRGAQGGAPGLAPERQMGGAFEAGYKTAMEHAKSEQQRF